MKKSIFLFFAALLCATSVCAVETFKDGQYIYFQIEGNSNWTQATYVPKFNWYWDSGNHQSGVLGTEVSGTSKKYYYATVPNAYIGYVQILRMNGSDTNTQWNYSKNLGASSDKTKNCLYFTSASWDNGTMSLKTYAPPMSSVTLSDNGTSIYGGNGSSSNPYLVEAGSKIKVKAEGTKAVEDPDATIYYNFKQGTSSKQNNTKTTYEFTSSTTTGTTYTINLDGYTKISSTSSTTKSATALYFKTVTPTIKFAGAPTNWEAREFSSNTFELELPRGTHEFKIIETIGSTDSWYGNNGIMTRQYHDNWTFRTKNDENNDEVNAQIKADVEGIYKLTWDFVTNELSVTYPTFPDLSNQPNPIYFQPTEAWKSDGARFAAYFFDDETGAAVTWKNLTDDDGDGVYEVSNDKKYLAVIFVRMNPAHNTNKWENDYNWNQTADLVIPINGDDRYTMTATGADNFDNSGKWSLVKHTISATADPVEGGSVEGANTYNYGTSVTLTATANPGYEFTGWSDGSTANPYTFTATKDVTLTAYFETATVEITEGNNSSVLTTNNGLKVNVEVQRQFTKDKLYTIALPFALNDVETVFGTGTIVYEYASLVQAGGEVVLNFNIVNSLGAGKPYLIAPTKDVNGFSIQNVILTNKPNNITFTVGKTTITMEAILSVEANATTDGRYWLAADKYLYNNENDLPALRALFNVSTTSGMPPRARVALGENAATGLDNITNGENTTIKVIENGQLIIIRNGEKFNAQGVRL